MNGLKSARKLLNAKNLRSLIQNGPSLSVAPNSKKSSRSKGSNRLVVLSDNILLKNSTESIELIAPKKNLKLSKNIEKTNLKKFKRKNKSKRAAEIIKPKEPKDIFKLKEIKRKVKFDKSTGTFKLVEPNESFDLDETTDNTKINEPKANIKPKKPKRKIRLNKARENFKFNKTKINTSSTSDNEKIKLSKPKEGCAVDDLAKPNLPHCFNTSLFFSPVVLNNSNLITPSLGVLKSIDNSKVNQVPRLAHGLDKVLFNPGYHYMRDQKSRSFLYSPFLHKLTQPEDFAYDRLTPFIPPSQDTKLQHLARSNQKRYVGSTSSLSGFLSHLYFLVSKWKDPDTHGFSCAFDNEPKKYTRATRCPSSVKVQLDNGIYSIDADKSFDVNGNVLMHMGKSMEKMLSVEQNEYEKYIKKSLVLPTEFTEECYHYSGFENFLLRSQLDCMDTRLKNRTFDLKTRAVVSIRHDIRNYKESCGYQIKKVNGILESFEREYYDMMRSAFLKYSFQTRIGQMDGIFVAYHNTARMLGFQYITVEEMDKRIFGNSLTGKYHFNVVLSMLSRMLDSITTKFPEKTLILSVEAKKNADCAALWVEVVNEKPFNTTIPQIRNATAPRVLVSESEKPVSVSILNGSVTQQAPLLNSQDSLNNSANEELDGHGHEHEHNYGNGREDQRENKSASTNLSPIVDIPYVVDPTSGLYKYTIRSVSTFNGMDLDTFVFLDSDADKWVLNWNMTEENISEDQKYAEYSNFRNKQRKYFMPKYNPDGSEKISELVQTLRRISKEGMHLNDV